jgi:hypothetical protein
VRLRIAVKGLEQGRRLWNNDFNTFLLSLWFTQSQANPHHYICTDGILILLYVDDICTMYAHTESDSKAAIDFKAKLSKKYKLMNRCSASQFLGIEFHRNENGTGISSGQNAFITTILKRFHMQDAIGVTTPMDAKVKLDLPNDRGEKELDKYSIKHYYVIVGSLMYAALVVRVDISHAVAALCQYNSRPFTSHMTAAKSVLQYLTPTADFQLHFNANNGVVRFTDSHCARDCTDRMSKVDTSLLHLTMVAACHGILGCMSSSPYQHSEPNTSPAPEPTKKRDGCYSYREMSTVLRTKHHYHHPHYRSTVTIRVPSHISQPE